MMLLIGETSDCLGLDAFLMCPEAIRQQPLNATNASNATSSFADFNRISIKVNTQNIALKTGPQYYCSTPHSRN